MIHGGCAALYVLPVLDSTGKLRGLCGMEMSNLYFRLSYPIVEGSCGNIVTVLAQWMKTETSVWIKAMFGDTKKRIFHPSGTMTVKKRKSIITPIPLLSGIIYSRHELLELKSCNGRPLAVLTLISRSEL